MSILKRIIRLAAPFPKIGQFERFLFIGPHPDDIEIGAGATAAKLAAQRKKICFLICTDGRFGTSNSSGIGPEEMAEFRKREAIESANMLGIEDVRFLGLSDGGFYEMAELVKGIAAVVGDFKPDVVVNLALPYQDLTIMDACLITKTSYVDTANYEPITYTISFLLIDQKNA